MMQDQQQTRAAMAADQAAVADCLSGDVEAFGCIVDRYQAMVARQMWHYTRDRLEHEALVQEVFVEAYQSLGRYTGAAPLEHWLARIAARTGYRHWRGKARDRVVDTAAAQHWAGRAAAAADRGGVSEAAECLYNLLQQLPPKDRAVLTCIYFEACSVDEAAERLGWNATLVKVRAFRARHKLRVLLEEAGYGPKG